MKPNKEEILEVLKTIYFDNQKIDIVSDNAVLNILVFDKEIIIDLNTNNPSLQGKNKIKLKILNSIQNKFSEDIDVKINFKLIKKSPNTILNTNRKLDGVQNIIAVSSGKGGYNCRFFRKRWGW